MIPIWLSSSFHLLIHGEMHYSLPEEFDQRLALISFDNAIESSIACYLDLHPALRGNREYQHEKVKGALQGNYHLKLDFLFDEVKVRNGICTITRQEIIYVHNQRGHFYHKSPDFVPSNAILTKAREAAFWVFAFLFEISDLETEVSTRIKQIRKVDLYQRNKEIDELIDESYPEIKILDYSYKASEVLYAVDPVGYREFVEEILKTEKKIES